MSTPQPLTIAAPSTPPWLALIESAPAWMRWSAAALVGYTLFLLTPTGQATNDTAIDDLGSIMRLSIEGAAFLWAAARTELPRRLVLALRISGWTSLATAANYAALIPQHLGGPVLLSRTADSGLALLAYLATLCALLVYPRTATRPGESTALLIDIVVTTGALGLLSWTLVTQTSAGVVSDPSTQTWIRAFGVAQLAVITGLNVVVVRGLAVPTRRAFWWFIAGQALYLPVVVLAQFSAARIIPDWPTDIVYFGGVLPTLVACHAMRTDPLTQTTHSGGPAWLRDLNPIPLSMPLFVGLALLAALTIGPAAAALPLAAALMLVSLLLALRLLLSAHHSATVAQADAAREQRRQADRLEAIGRLAGGIAHEFNNLMARVIGNTELGEAALPPLAEAREHFVRARAAALRAADLTSQLVAFSGQQKTRLEIVDADTIVHTCYARAARSLPRAIEPHLEHGEGPYAILADAAQLSAAVEHVIENALEAMPHGGRLTVRIVHEHLRDGLRGALLGAPPGKYVAIAVSDTGVGMTPAALALACDPFYSTKPRHLGAGLGLATVHGVIAAHSGGLAIESTLGAGTTVRLYLPAA